MRLCLLW